MSLLFVISNFWYAKAFDCRVSDLTLSGCRTGPAVGITALLCLGLSPFLKLSPR